MTLEEYQARVQKISADLYDLKEDLLFEGAAHPQRDFEAGALEAALQILDAFVPPGNPEADRRMEMHTRRALFQMIRESGL